MIYVVDSWKNKVAYIKETNRQSTVIKKSLKEEKLIVKAVHKGF